MARQQFTFASAVGALIDAAAYSRAPAIRRENRFVDRKWVQAENLLAAFGMPLADDEEIRFRDLAWSPAGPVPRMALSVILAASQIIDHRAGYLSYTPVPGEEDVWDIHEEDITALRGWLRGKQVAMVVDLLALAKPGVKHKIIQWSDEEIRRNRWGYEPEIDENW